MIAALVNSVLQLTRIDSSLLAYASVFVPVYWSSNNISYALDYSVPVLPICMCGYVINDLHDIEKDRQNHPARPLPSNQISQTWASVIYFVLLAISLAPIKVFIKDEYVYLYLLLLLALIITITSSTTFQH
jgi:geranylgeranylglycerol-phosphate geranylgeranyltransferase